MESDEKQKTFFGVTTRYGAARAIALIGYSVVCTVALIAGPFGIVQGIRTESEEAVGAGVMAFLVAPLGYLVYKSAVVLLDISDQIHQMNIAVRKMNDDSYQTNIYLSRILQEIKGGMPPLDKEEVEGRGED